MMPIVRILLLVFCVAVPTHGVLDDLMWATGQKKRTWNKVFVAEQGKIAAAADVLKRNVKDAVVWTDAAASTAIQSGSEILESLKPCLDALAREKGHPATRDWKARNIFQRRDSLKIWLNRNLRKMARAWFLKKLKSPKETVVKSKTELFYPETHASVYAFIRNVAKLTECIMLYFNTPVPSGSKLVGHVVDRTVRTFIETAKTATKTVQKAAEATVSTVADAATQAVKWTGSSLSKVADAVKRAAEVTAQFASDAWKAILDFGSCLTGIWKKLLLRLLFGGYICPEESDVNVELDGAPKLEATLALCGFGAPRQVQKGDHTFSTEGTDLKWQYQSEVLVVNAAVRFAPTIEVTVEPTLAKLRVEISGEVHMQADIALSAERSFEQSRSAVFPKKPLMKTGCVPFFCITIMLQGRATINAVGTVEGKIEGEVSAKYAVDGFVELDIGSGEADAIMNAGQLTHQEQVSYESGFSGTVSLSLGPVFTILPTPGAPVSLEPLVTAQFKAAAKVSDSDSPCAKVGITVSASPGIDAFGFPPEMEFDSKELEDKIIEEIMNLPLKMKTEVVSMVASCIPGGDSVMKSLTSRLDGILSKASNLIRTAVPDVRLSFGEPQALIRTSVCFNVLTLPLPDSQSCSDVDLGCDAPATPDYEPQRPCIWRPHSNKYSGGYAGGVSTMFSLEVAKQECIRLGQSKCKAITCNQRKECTMRASSHPIKSPSKETSYVPTSECFESSAEGQEAASTTSPPPTSYYALKKGSCCCPSEDEIETREDCRRAHDALGLNRRKEWSGAYGSIPGGCSTRQSGSHDLHWNTRQQGRARSDMTPICKKGSGGRRLLITDQIVLV